MYTGEPNEPRIRCGIGSWEGTLSGVTLGHRLTRGQYTQPYSPGVSSDAAFRC